MLRAAFFLSLFTACATANQTHPSLPLAKTILEGAFEECDPSQGWSGHRILVSPGILKVTVQVSEAAEDAKLHLSFAGHTKARLNLANVQGTASLKPLEVSYGYAFLHIYCREGPTRAQIKATLEPFDLPPWAKSNPDPK